LLQLLCGIAGEDFLAKIAVALQRALAERRETSSTGCARPQLLAEGEGWSVNDVLCTSGPKDKPYEEQHSRVSIAMVVAGSFRYRCGTGCELMTPGSLLLGNAGDFFECGHEHGDGDRCISFRYDPEYFESIVAPVAAGRSFTIPRIPALDALSPLVVRSCAGLDNLTYSLWEELAVRVAAQTTALSAGMEITFSETTRATAARISHVVRLIEDRPHHSFSLAELAHGARLSPYHFLRSFQSITGLTPHQYLLRTRLREAAIRLADYESLQEKILDIALDCGFGDISNFNRAFRREFGVSPRVYRKISF
jgi:AraC-like DNA-binding protein